MPEYQVQTTDGQTLVLSYPDMVQGAPQETPLRLQPGMDPSIPEKPSRLRVREARKVRMFRGWHEHWISEDQFAVYVRRGFTTQPTAVEPEAKWKCGVQGGDGTFCDKMLISEPMRLVHINAYHRDVAAWVLTEVEKRKLRNELGIMGPGVQVESRNESEELAALREQVKKLTELVEKTANVSVRKEKRVRAPFNKNHTPHALFCATKGRLKQYTNGCVRCEELVTRN